MSFALLSVMAIAGLPASQRGYEAESVAVVGDVDDGDVGGEFHGDSPFLVAANAFVEVDAAAVDLEELTTGCGVVDADAVVALLRTPCA